MSGHKRTSIGAHFAVCNRLADNKQGRICILVFSAVKNQFLWILTQNQILPQLHAMYHVQVISFPLDTKTQNWKIHQLPVILCLFLDYNHGRNYKVAVIFRHQVRERERDKREMFVQHRWHQKDYNPFIQCKIIALSNINGIIFE